jgi:lysine 2,3-aminomutase
MGIKIIESLIGHTSGLAIPRYVIDAPGGGGKIPIQPKYLLGTNKKGVLLRNYEGKIYTYPKIPLKEKIFTEKFMSNMVNKLSSVLVEKVN